jgi:anti-sigma factor RsiW
VRAKVEHPFRVIKRQFGLAKVRFRGLAKNTAHVVTLFGLSNLWMARRRLMARDQAGYRIAHWLQGGMRHCVISDVNREEFERVVNAVRSTAAG